MHIVIPFPMDTIRMSFGKPASMWGRDVASYSFLRALALAGEVSKLTLWVPTPADAELLGKTLLAEIPAAIQTVIGNDLTQHLDRFPPDVLHVMDPNMWIGGHIRNFMTERDFVITGITHSLANQHFLEWSVLSNANGVEQSDCLICTTPTAESVVQSMFTHLTSSQPDYLAPSTEVIPLGLDLESFRRPTHLGRQDFGLRDDEFVVLSLARFNPASKMDMLPLLNLVEMLRVRTTANIRLLMAGSAGGGEYVNILRDQVSKRGLDDAIVFVTNPTEEQKVALYQQADVFLSLSDNIQETFGLTIIEALASGLPVVASDWNGYRSLIIDGTTGFLVPTKTLAPNPAWEAGLSLQPDARAHVLSAQATAVDLPHTCDALLTLAGDKALRAQMSKAAAEFAVRHDWPAIIPGYLALWQRLCVNRRAASAAGRNRRSSAVAFLHDFAVYPTTALSPEDRFLTSETGLGLLQGKTSVAPYEDTREILDFTILSQVLNGCRQSKTLQQLYTELSPAGSQQQRLRVAQNVLWLYKYGYLTALQH